MTDFEIGSRIRTKQNFTQSNVVFNKGDTGIFEEYYSEVIVTIYWDKQLVLSDSGLSTGHGRDNKCWIVPAEYLELVTKADQVTAQKLCTCNMNSLMIRGCHCGGK